MHFFVHIVEIADSGTDVSHDLSTYADRHSRPGKTSCELIGSRRSRLCSQQRQRQETEGILWPRHKSVFILRILVTWP